MYFKRDLHISMLSFILLLLTFSVYFDKKEAEGRRESDSLMHANLEVYSRQLGLKEHHPSVPHPSPTEAG